MKGSGGKEAGRQLSGFERGNHSCTEQTQAEVGDLPLFGV